MKTSKTLAYVFKNGCVIFTVITMIIYGIGTILSDADKSFIPTFQWIILFFVFSQLLSGANQILRMDRFSLPLRIFLHFFATAILYIVAVVLCGGLYKSGTMLLLSILLLIVGYIIFAALYSARIRKQKNAAKGKGTYKSVFH